MENLVHPVNPVSPSITPCFAAEGLVNEMETVQAPNLKPTILPVDWLLCIVISSMASSK